MPTKYLLRKFIGNDRTPDASGRNRTGPDVRSGPAGHISEGPDRTGTSGRKFRPDDVRDVRPLPPGVGE